MKHAVAYSLPPTVRERIRQKAIEVGDDQWTIHDELIIEYPDDRDIIEVIHPLLEELEEVAQTGVESGRPTYGQPDPDDFMAFSSLVLSPRSLAAFDNHYERPDNRPEASFPLE